MSLSKNQLKFLRHLAHQCKTIIWIGHNGLTDAVMKEVELALDYHELIKIKLRVGDREIRDETIQELCQITGAELVQKIGNIIAIYRRNIKKTNGIMLPRS